MQVPMMIPNKHAKGDNKCLAAAGGRGIVGKQRAGIESTEHYVSSRLGMKDWKLSEAKRNHWRNVAEGPEDRERRLGRRMEKGDAHAK